MHRLTKVLWAAVWIIVAPLIFAAFMPLIRPEAKHKASKAQAPAEATLFLAEERRENRGETTQLSKLHPRLQEATRKLRKKRKISKDLLMNQLPIAELKKLFEEGDIIWAPSQGQKYLLMEQDKRIKEEKARLKDEKLKENKVKRVAWVVLLIITGALIFARFLALIRPKAKDKQRST